MTTMLWLILACQCLTILALWGLLVVHNRDWLTRFVALEEKIGQGLKRNQDLLDVTIALRREIAESLKPKPEPELEYPAGTSFLPDDASQAELEKLIKQSEDRSLGPVRTQFSSRPSNPSQPGSRREPSTRAARRSGTG